MNTKSKNWAAPALLLLGLSAGCASEHDPDIAATDCVDEERCWTSPTGWFGVDEKHCQTVCI